MNYGRVGPSEPGCSTRSDQPLHTTSSSSPRKNKCLLLVLTVVLSLALIISSAAILMVTRSRSSSQRSPNSHRKPTQAISKTCSKTRYEALCVSTLLNFTGSTTATEQELIHISFNMTLQHFNKALYLSSAISYLQMDTRVRSAYDDCLELLDDSVDALSRSLSVLLQQQSGTGLTTQQQEQDVMTWLSAALTNQDTCVEGFADLNGAVKDQMGERLKDLSELVSNCLALFSSTESYDFAGIPIENKRRLLSNADEFPSWLGRWERRLLGLPLSAIQADIVVAKDGNGTCKTIAEAIKRAPEYSNRRTVIYVMAGR